MTSSSSSSSSRAPWLIAGLALLVSGTAAPQQGAEVPQGAAASDAAAGLAPGPASGAPRLALFPVQNLSGGAAPSRELTAAFRERLEKRGFALVADDRVRRTLVARRVRYTGGLDRETAKALHDEVGVDGVIIAALETWSPVAPFRLAMTARLVTTEGEPTIRWLDTYARSGADSPGLFGVNLLVALEPLRDQALDQFVSSLVASLRDPRPAPACPDRGVREPNRMFRSPLAADPARRTLAVLPFVSDARRRDAGEVMALRMLAPLVASGTIQVVEPGVVRSEMLTYRFGATGGISLDDARAILELVNADLVLSGTVRTFEDASGPGGAPRVDFSTWVLDREQRRLVWSSTASAAGDDGVFFFGLGRVTTASALACSMAKGVVGPLLRDRPPSPRRNPAGSAPHPDG